MRNINNKFPIIVNIKNIEEALIAEKNGADALLLLDEIPKEIIEMEVSGPQFKLSVVKELLKVINIPLFVRVRIGNLNEIKILETVGINSFYEINIVKTKTKIEYAFKDPKNTYITEGNDLQSIIKRISDGFQIITISSKNIETTLNKLVNIYNEIKKISLFNTEKLDKYCQYNNISDEIVKKITINKKFPCSLFISNIAELNDINIFKDYKCLINLIDGFFIENEYFSIDHLSELELFRSSLSKIKL
tara:strand:- start:168 stop:911 length:744 start_codon:yes stop_codon:yes gene_type:complete